MVVRSRLKRAGSGQKGALQEIMGDYRMEYPSKILKIEPPLKKIPSIKDLD